jgi:hypothetical protein
LLSIATTPVRSVVIPPPLMVIFTTPPMPVPYTEVGKSTPL